MPLLQRLSKQVGCRIWDAIQAKLKELQQKDKINKTLVDYIFVLFDPANDETILRSKLVDFLGDKTDVFIEWFIKVVQQVDNQVTKAQSEMAKSATTPPDGSVGQKSTPTPEKDAPTAPVPVAVPDQHREEPSLSRVQTSTSEAVSVTHATKKAEGKKEEHEQNDDADRSRRHHRSGRRRERGGGPSDQAKDHGASVGVSRILTKAARDAVRSVQAVSGGQDMPMVEKKKHEETEPMNHTKSTHEVMVVDADADEKIVTLEEEQPEGESSRGQPIAVKIGRGGHKRPLDERDVRGTTTIVSAPAAPPRADSPLIVPDYRHQEEIENVQDEESEEIPGLLVVMPSYPSSRVIVGSEQYGRRWGGFQAPPEFTVSGIGRPPFQPPHQQNAMDEGDVEMDGSRPAKRFRPGGKPNTPADTSAVPCRFLPRCAKKAGICPYFHPPCRNGKFCRFGTTCVFDHSGTPAGAAVKPTPPIATKVPFCIYAPFCTQPRCKFLHKQPVVCSFGAQCRMGPVRCAFLHPEDLADGESTVGDRSDLQITDFDDDSEPGTEDTGDVEILENEPSTVSALHPEMDQPEPALI